MSTSNFQQPLDGEVACAVAQLDEAWREAFEERAAILEYEGGMTRLDAERAALQLVLVEQQQRATCPAR